MTDKILSQKYFDILLSLYSENKFQDTIDYGLSLKEKHKFAFIYNFVGASFAGLEKYDEGVFYYKKAISIDRNYFEVYVNISESYRNLKKYNLAINSSKRAIEIKNNSIKGYFILANIYDDLEDYNNAILFYNEVLKIEPNNFETNNNLGILYFRENDVNKALYHYNIALQEKQNSPEIFNNLGLLYKDIGSKEHAIKFFKKSLELNSNFIDANFNMGNTLKDVKDYTGSIQHYDKVLKLNPSHAEAFSQRLLRLAHICDWNEINKCKNQINQIGLNENEIEPFAMLSFDDCAKRNQERAELYAKNKFIKKDTLPKLKARKNIKEKKIRLGYFSSDFCNHAMMFLLKRMFELHNKDKFEIYAYSIVKDRKDEMYFNVKKLFKCYRNISDKSDNDIKEIVKNDKIDIAIDLNGYTGNNKAKLFFKRLAPIQINYLGYPGTMGSSVYDYIFADKIVIPESQKKYFNEKVLYLPNTYQPTDNKRNISPKRFMKVDCSLPSDSFVFCCFNNNYKISKVEFDIWIKLLKTVPNSVLWLFKSNKYAEENIKRYSYNNGINPGRVIFAEFFENSEHLSRHSCADLFLDTFYYGAHTTASDALWSGLPVITKIGSGFASRVCSSLLNAINLPELITQNVDEYEALALNLALNPHKLKQIRAKLKQNILSSSLFDTEKYTYDFEELLESTIK